MKKFILLLLLLASIKIYSQTLTATGSSNVLTTSATCSGTYTGTYDIEGDLLIQYSVNSNFANPKASQYITASDTSGGVITINISGLSFNTTYYFRFKGTSDSDGLLKTSNSLNFTTANLIQASDIEFSNIQSTQVTASFTPGNGDNRIVLVKQGSAVDGNPVDGTTYTPNGTFGSGTQIGTGNYVVAKGDINSSLVTGLTSGNIYYFKVFEYTGVGSTSDFRIDGFPAGTNPNSVNLTGEPTTQATSVNFTSVAQTSFTANWTRGNGDSVLVVAKASTIANGPTDGTHYNANTTFASGTAIDGGYVVYKGTGTSVAITGLSAGTTYYIMAYEYNTASNSPNYKTGSATGNPNSQATLKAEPTTQASLITFPIVGTTSMTINWTNGNGDNRIVAVRETDQGTITNPSDNSTYTASTNWSAKGTQLGTSGYYTVYNGSSNSVALTNLNAGTTYWVQVFEYNNSVGSENYYTATATDNPISSSTYKLEPSTQATSLIFTNVTGNSLTIDWTTGDGDGAVLIARAGAAIADFPADGSTYTDNLAFGSGSNLGNNTFVLYSGAGTTANITGLSGYTTYYFMVCESNNSGTGTDYKTTAAAGNPNSQTTLNAEPTTQASLITFPSLGATSMTINWTSGNGENRIVAVRETDQGTITNPSDNSTYTASTDWTAKGSQLGASGYYIVYNGNSNSVALTNLNAATTYWVQVFEYNNSAGSENYYTATATDNPISTTTFKLEPATQATNLIFSNVTSSSLTVDWTTGDGDGAVLIARAGTAIANFPVDGTTYTANLAFGTGSDLGNSTFVLYSGAGTTANITNLTPGVTYYFMVCESNNTGPGTDYNTNPASNNPLSQATLKLVPTTQASNILFSNVQSNQLTLTWTNGDGDNRVVLMKQASVVNASPTNGTTYSANTVFGSGTQIGSGNYVVYNSNSNTTTVTNLVAGTTYYIKIFEYNNTGTEILYKTNGFSSTNPTDTITPASAPTIQASNLVFSNILTDGITINWTRGNGDSVLIVAKAGSTITETPTDGTAYNDNTAFASGDAIATGVYAVYTGIGTSTTVTGLTASTEYVFKAFEFKNGEPYTTYLTSDATNNPLSHFTTGTEPTVQADNITFANTTSIQTDVTYTAGTGGTGRIVLCHANTPVDANPVDGFIYTANSAFGSGEQIGTGNYVVANDATTGVTVTNLTPEIKYHFKVFEYSGSGGSINYLLSDGTDNPDSITTIIGKPVTQASNVTFTNLASDSYRVSWTRGSGQNVLVVGVAGAFTSGENPVDASIYTANSAFTSGTAIGSGYVVYNGNTPDYVDVTALTANTNYSFKVFEYNTPGIDPFYQTNDGTNNPVSRFTLATEPTSQASSVAYSSIGATQVTLSWTNGDGTNRIVIAHAATDIVSDPIDGTGYTDNSVFATGDEIGTAHYVVYNGVGTGVTVTGLNPNTIYYFRVYEYNGTLTTCNYLTSLGSSSNTTTIKAEPTIQAQEISFSALTNTTYTVNWTRGDAVNNDGVIILAHQGGVVDQFPADGSYGQVVNSVFGGGTEIGTGNFVVYKGTGTSVMVSGLTLNNEYHFRAFEYNNTGSSTDYLTSTATGNPNSSFTLDQEPTTQASNITFPNIGADTIQLNWTNGDGNGRIVVACSGTAVTATPSDEVTYTANNLFGSGTAITPGNYVVYAGTSNSFVVRGLTGGITYHFQVFEYNNTGVINYYTATASGNPNSQLTGVAGAPTTQASDINFSNINTASFTINWTSGNGTNRIVALKAGSGTITDPSNNSTYLANSVFQTGDQLGISGYYIVYNGNGNSVSVTGLTNETEYFAQVYEYNNSPGNEVYLTSTVTGNPNSQFTLKLAPVTQASAITLSNEKTDAVDIAWTNGNGENRIVVARLTADGIVNPSDGTNYNANTVFGSGDATGTGNYVVYNGVGGSTVTVTGLAASTSYTFVVYEYNNTLTNILFNTTVTADVNSKATVTLGTANWLGGDVGNETDWATAANWSTVAVPTSSYTVVIPSSATYMPIITSASAADYVTITAGASISIADGGSLTVSNNLLLEASSDATSSGMLVIPGTGTISVGGSTTMERYMPSTTNWHFASFPNSPNINVFAGSYVNSYNESALTWDHLTSASSIATMQGIAVKYSSGSQTRSFTGGFNNGNQSINVTNGSPGDDNYGWNMVGNPYPCTIDWDAASGWTLNNVDATAYYFNSSSGSYSSYNANSHSGTGGGTRYIASAQGFFVHASDNGSLAMTNAVRVANTENYRKNGAIEKQLIRIEASNDEYNSDAVLLFYSNATDEFDAAYDALKLIATNEDISDIYFNANQSKYSINTYSQNKLQELASNEMLAFPLGITPGKTGLVTIRLSEITGIPSEVFVLLHDKAKNQYFDLRKTNCEVFVSATTDTRFELVLSKNELAIPEKDLANEILIYTIEKSVFVKLADFIGTKGMVYVYDISGRIVYSKEINYTEIQRIDLNTAGSYIVKVIINNKIATQIVVVR